MKKQIVALLVCIFLVGSWFSGIFVSAQAPAGDGMVEVEVPVRGSFLRSIDDWPYYGPGQKEYDEYLEIPVGDYTDFRIEEPAIVNLEAHDIFEGDTVYIGWSGGEYPDGAWDPANPGSRTMGLRENEKVPYGGLLGLFSTTSELKDIDVLNRVPGAINFSKSYTTPETIWDNGRAEISQKLAEKNVEWYNGSITTDIPEDFYISPYTGMLVDVPINAKFLFISLIDEYYRDNFEGPNLLTVTIEKDSDKDGLPDSWEKNGIYVNDDNIVDLDLPALGARWDRKDIFVEIDYMGASGGHDHRPNIDAIRDVIDAFDKAPVKNPGPDGINLHVIEFIDQEIPHQEKITMWNDFDKIKKTYFGTDADNRSANKKNILDAKKLVFHYCLFVHLQQGGTWSGRGELPGNDFVVSLGGFTGSTGTREEQAGTFMHELGHNLGLHHGGDDDIQYKPNYLSVMNYLFQIPSSTSNLFSRPLTFSSERLLDLDEKALNENLGLLEDVDWSVTVFSGVLQTSAGTSYVPIPVSTSGSIDWDNDGIDTEAFVEANINHFPQWDYNSSNNEILEGFDDWDNLIYRFRGYPSSADGFHPNAPENELTFELAEAIKEELSKLEPPKPSGKSVEFSELKVDVSALGTFLRADPIMEEGGSPVEEPTIIDLEATGLLEEKWIVISYSGKIFHAIDWGDGDPKEDGYINLIGIFSTTSELESIDKLNRVPGAIDSNRDFVTDETYFGELQTDIPEDFLSGDETGTTIEIPDGAKFLFLCNPDVYYPDNFGSFQVTIKTLETGQSDSVFPIEIIIIIILVIVAAIILFIAYKRKKGNESKSVTV